MNPNIRHDAMSNWAVALATAPHVLEGGTIDNPQMIQRLADSSASLHGLVAYIREHYEADELSTARLDWDIDLLGGASAFLYRNLGLSEEAAVDRLKRLSGAMMGTAKYMEGDHLQTWSDIRREAEKTGPLAA